MRFIILIIILLIAKVTFAQKDVEATISPMSAYDSARSYYIKSFPEHFFVWPVLKQRKLDFEMQNLLTKKRALQYNSNRPYSFGIGVYMFELGMEFTFAIPLDEQNKRIYGESDTRDFQLNLLGKKWGVDAFVQRYNGFYIRDKNETINPNTPFPQRPDIETKNIGLTGNYVFNNKKFSFRSAYNYAERQLQSGGSPLMFASVSSFKVSGDSAIIGDRYIDDFGAAADINKIRTTIFGVAPGYTYSLIYRGFFLNGMLAAGPAHNWLAYQVESGRTTDDIKFSAFVAARIAIGYNGDNFFGGLSFINQGRNAKFENLELVNSNSTFKILFGYRFKEFGFLKKRIWDLPKELW